MVGSTMSRTSSRVLRIFVPILELPSVANAQGVAPLFGVVRIVVGA
jgi:hypothetical protein